MAYHSTQSAAGTPAPGYTDCFLKNKSFKVLNLMDAMVWEGDKKIEFPKQIKPGEDVEFRHFKGLSGGSVVGLVYAAGEKKWIIAWSNTTKEPNSLLWYKVFTQILFEGQDVDPWDVIKNALDKSGNHCELQKVSSISDIEINNPLYKNPTSTVTMKTKYEEVLVADDNAEPKA